MAMSTTTIPVKQETLARLRSHKIGGATYDDVLNDLMDDQPPAGFIREHLRRLKEETFSDRKDVQRRSQTLLDRVSDERVSESEVVAMVQDWRSKRSRH